jgi:hypothetical protein
VLLNDWAYFPPEKATDCLHPIRSVCSVWRAIIDADITQLALTVPSIRPACLAENFPNTTHLDLSRYHQHSQEVLSVLEHLKLKYASVLDRLLGVFYRLATAVYPHCAETGVYGCHVQHCEAHGHVAHVHIPPIACTVFCFCLQVACAGRPLAAAPTLANTVHAALDLPQLPGRQHVDT